MKCAIFQINTDLTKVYNHINIFRQETLQPLFIWDIFSKQTSLFFLKQLAVSGNWHSRFTICLLVLTLGELCNISNKNKFLTGQQKILHTSFIFKENQLSIRDFSGNIHFLPLFTGFENGSVKCLILQINTSFLISQQKTYFHSRDFTYLLYISPYNRIQDPAENLRWIFLRKQLTATQENNYYFPKMLNLRQLHFRCSNGF